MTQKAFAYLRVSGLAQVEGEGFPRQLSACEQFAQRNDYEIVRTFREEGITGKSELDNRPALQELIAELLADGVKVVIIEKLDRLARSLMVQETIVQDLRRRDITIISAAEPDICSDDPTRVMIRQILGAFFEYERKMITSKLADARRRVKARLGRCEGVKPFGHNDQEKHALRCMMGLRVAGQTFQQIAVQLNSQQVPTRSGKPWCAGSVAKILNREQFGKQKDVTFQASEVSQ